MRTRCLLRSGQTPDRLDSQNADLVLEVGADVLRAVVVAQRSSRP
jgi:hypothetical protein